ncbi:hypothetical protein C2R22_22220 (plasmid) [Salinigranum rubrum]|uniref:Uncharacterized protein n=1 Tax=Salinigranum rubrum TaxID=755307 RepID=A0A2I8VQS9_9EURY|nr:hypothetical protein [Salinigranum rubrum]AUV84282.1 hypothetical protein C2R22_22220 [Salinigranum rubrum]
MSNEMTSHDPLSNDDGFWGLLLGKKYDKIPESERTLENLVSDFYVGRTKRIDSRFESVDDLLAELNDQSPDRAQQLLLTIWAEEKWAQKSSGGNGFQVETNFEDELRRLEDEGLFVEELIDGFTLVWPSKEVRVTTREDDRVRSRLFERAHPLFVRKNGGGEVEVRGAKNRIKKFSKTFTDSDGVDRIERSQTTQEVIDGLASIFNDEIEALTLTEVEFQRTYLPDGSSLSLSNPTGVRNDLNSEAVFQELVDLQSLSELSHLGFNHNKTGKKVELKVEREETGFYFEIQDRYLPESEKEAIRLLIEDKLGISFDSIYPYDVQLRDSYIFHQILTGAVETYNRYFEDLPEEEQSLLNEFIDVAEIDTFECYRCHEVYEEEKPDKCDECEGDSFRDDIRREVSVDDEAIHEAAFESLKEIRDTLSDNGINFLDVSIDAYETKHNDYIRATFQEVASAGKEANTHRYEYINYCLGNGRLPRRINQYLLNSVLVVYGKAYLNGREHFGTIDLHDLLMTDSPEDLLTSAIRDSKSQFRNRIIGRADEAFERLQDLHQRGAAGEFDDLSQEEREELKEDYDYNEFERDVFYLLKFMFLFTERWGREGETETDGCLVIPEDDGYFIASYDPKLTYTKKGYDLDAGEKNKAAWYMVTENLGGALSVSLSDDENLDAHLFVSNKFREGQFPYVASRVQEWFEQSEDVETGDIPVAFLPLESLLSLYDTFDRHYDPIIEYPSVKAAFRRAFIEKIRSGEDGYSVVDTDACDAVEERVLQALKGTTRSRTLKDHTE